MDKKVVLERLTSTLKCQPEVLGNEYHFALNGVHLLRLEEGESGLRAFASTRTSYSSLNSEQQLEWLLTDRKLLRLLSLAEKLEGVPVCDESFELTGFDYSPGDKWSCGCLNLTAATSLGELVWEEVVPGPRHSEDSREVTVTLNGVKVPYWGEDGLLASLEFEAPGKPGKWADEFASREDEVEEEFRAWFVSERRLLQAELLTSQTV